MNDLINRQAAIDAVLEVGITEYDEAIVIEAIKELPSAQPKKGKWIQISKFPDRVEGYWVTCSACDRRIFGGGKFCPLCGADMGKED